MVENIVVGRDRDDLQKFGQKGVAYIGKHIVGEGEEAHLTNPVLLDVARPHIILICGKRGCGKSYSGGVIAEEITRLPADIRKNLSVLLLDTMGIYWSSKQPNEKDRGLLEKWGLKPQGMDITFFVPKPHLKSYQDAGIAVDAPFVMPCADMRAEDWILTFGFSPLDPHGLLLSRVVKQAQEHYGAFVLQDLVDLINDDKKADPATKDAVASKFEFAKEWGVFEKEGTAISDLFSPGKVSVLDISHFSGGTESWSVKSMLVGMLSRRIYQERLEARKIEEKEEMTGETVETIPMAWMIIDEAHMFLPSGGETPASEPLLTLVKQGREPGISLVLITQRPNKLHEDALAQADLVISHRLTAQPDLEALRGIMQTYMFEAIQEYINMLPRQKGTAIILDDNSERIFTVTIRPRFSWHSGGSPSAIRRKGLFEK